MKIALAFSLFVFLALSLAQAAVPSCVLKITTVTPNNWDVFKPAAGNAKIEVNATVRDLVSGSPYSSGSLRVILDNGYHQYLTNPLTANYLPATGTFSVMFLENLTGLHRINISVAGWPAGCIPDSSLTYYQYYESALTGVPDFNVFLLPLMGLAAVFVARRGK